jgi:hypothetical protein
LPYVLTVSAYPGVLWTSNPSRISVVKQAVLILSDVSRGFGSPSTRYISFLRPHFYKQGAPKNHNILLLTINKIWCIYMEKINNMPERRFKIYRLES